MEEAAHLLLFASFRSLMHIFFVDFMTLLKKGFLLLQFGPHLLTKFPDNKTASIEDKKT
jgi:hypothetical protein